MDIINWLEDWLESNCDGGWEHLYGVDNKTIDNPGWHLKLNILDTLYEDVTFDDITIDRTEHDWVRCKKSDGNIDCAGGPRNLNEMLGIIKKWMEDNKPDPAVLEEHNREVMEGREIHGIKFDSHKDI